MKPSRSIPYFFLALLSLSGCLNAGTQGPMERGCQIFAADDLKIWINAMPGPRGPIMVVQFTAEVPTPGYGVTAKVASIQEIAPPRYVVEVMTTPPKEIVAQVVTSIPVRLEIPVQEDRASGVEVTCDGARLFVVDGVETAY